MVGSQDEKLKVYEQLCISYRAIDDFRAKLLGFLPLATGTGIFLLFNNLFPNLGELTHPKIIMMAVGAFGFLITLGLSFYEIYGIMKCHALIEAGKQLEGELRTYGQFGKRPRGVIGLINEPFAAGVIYPAVLAAWTFLAFYLLSSWVAAIAAIFVFIVGFAISYYYNRELREGRMDITAAIITIDPVLGIHRARRNLSHPS